MVVLKASVKRILSFLLLTVVLTAIPCVALAANSSAPTDDAVIDFNAKGSITVTKYATADTVTAKNPAGTGMNNQTPTEQYRPIAGVTFKLFKIADADAVKAYYNGTSESTYSLDLFSYDEATGSAAYNGNAITEFKEGITGEDGTYKFADLPVGIYVLKEVTAPTQIVAPLAAESMISVPMVNTATSSNNENAKWVYDVYVYPKNNASTGTVELTKLGQTGMPLKDVAFALYKKDFGDNGELPAGDWTKVTKDGEESNLTLTTGADGKLTLANLPAGKNGTQYQLVELSAPDGYIVNQTPLYFKVNRDFTLSWNSDAGEKGDCNNKNSGATAQVDSTKTKLSINLGNEQPSLIKHVRENGGDTWKTDEQYRLDDEILYRLIVSVPSNVAELATFTIRDLPQTGITDSTSCTVTYGDTADACVTQLDAGKFTVDAIPADTSNGQGFALNLTADGKAAVAGKYIQIVYATHMNANAVIAGSGNGNTASLIYSKYIGNTDTSTYTISDEARVYTYQYQITKYKGSVASGNRLGPGVEFQLLDSNKDPMKVVRLADGKYRLAINTDVDTDTLDKMLTGSNSTILIQGLENGTYYLEETKTLEGYNLLSEPFEITLNVTETTTWAENGTFTASGKVVKGYENTAYDVTEAMGTGNIINKRGFVLPQTGGMGYLLFCAVGIALIAGGAALIFGGRKKKTR